MKTASGQQHIIIRRSAAALWFVCAALAAGCGVDMGSTAGVGSGGTGGGPVITYAMAGRVADGYLVHAIVFLDKNDNYQLNENEPFAITGENGAFKLNVDPADVGNYPLVVLAIKGVTIDKDNNLPVENSYILSKPKESIHGIAENFISPISSQLHEMMKTGKYANIEQAAEALRIKMGLPVGTSIQADYVATQNRTVHAVAQNMVALMASQMEQVLAKDGTVDVNLYRGMMSAINSTIPLIADKRY